MSYSLYGNLRNYCYFSCLSDNALEELAKNLHAVKFPAGTEIIREGSAADAFYLIADGTVEVVKRTVSGQNVRLSVIGHGEGFGEMALLTSSPRFCSVTATTDVKLLKLLKRDFEEIVRMDSAFSRVVRDRLQGYGHYNRIKTLEPFAHLEAEKTVALLDALGEITCPPGKTIIQQGEKGDVYYIVKAGNVSVMKKMTGDEAVNVAMLHEGEGFGEEALITGQPRNATVRSIGEVALWTLSKSDFERIMKSTFLVEIQPEDVLKEKKTNAFFLDVRMRTEFDEEHIPESLHIPLDELRKRYHELDPSAEYYVYCLLGARSASAAFLLRSRGLRATSIKGGILNWPGPVVEESGGVHTPFSPT